MRVIVLNVDGLPAWALGAYGNDWLPTPNLDEFAASAVVFDQHYADVPRTLAPRQFSCRSWFAGGPASPITLPSEVSWIDALSLLPPWTIDGVTDDDELMPLVDPKAGLLAPDDHETFERLRFTFSSVVHGLDTWFGEWLSENEVALADTMVIVTSGRGQNLGEHGLVGEAHAWLHEELVHLPLIVRLPGRAEAGRRVPHLTQTTDVAATILTALREAPTGDCHGHDLMPLCRGGGPVRDYVVMASVDGNEHALQTLDVKIIVAGAAVVRSLRDREAGHGVTGPQSRGAMYFIKPDDRWEVNDLRLPNLDHAEQLEQTLRDYLAACAEPGPLKAPPLPQWENADGDGETGGREHVRPASAGGL